MSPAPAISPLVLSVYGLSIDLQPTTAGSYAWVARCSLKNFSHDIQKLAQLKLLENEGNDLEKGVIFSFNK